MERRHLTTLVLAAAVLACGWLLWTELDAAGVLDSLFRSSAEDGGGELRTSDARPALVAELRERARLRGLPGIRTAPGGAGRLTGAVQRNLAGTGPAPLPGVEVRVIGIGDGRSRHYEAVTDADGLFAFEELPALVGYAVVVDHPPFKEVLLKGIGVRRDRTSDVGVILLGASTSLTGHVVDGAGRPVPGALAQVFFDRTRPRRFDLRRGLIDLQSALEPLSEARAWRDGRFDLAGLPPGRYVVRVSAPGYATAFRESVWVTADERASVLHVVLARGAGYEGRILDPDERGIGGALVIAVAFPDRRSTRLDRVEATAESDGRYRLDGLVAGVRYFVEAWAEGYAPAGRFVQPEEIETLDFVLPPSGRVEGRITDVATGAGVQGAEVTLVAGTANTLSPVSCVSGVDGRYALTHVSPGPILMFAAKASGYPAASFDLAGSRGRKVVAGEVLVIDQALESGRIAFGRVSDESGQPVAYATLAFADPKRRAEGEETALTGTDGTYRVEGLRETTYEVWIQAPGYAPPTEDEEARLEVPSGVVEVRHDFVLARGAAVSGTVTDPQGAPIRGAHVEIRAQGNRSLRERVQDLVAVTAPTGRWRITGIPPRVEVVVRAGHDEWIRTESSPLRLSPGQEQEVNLALGAGVGLSGVVTDTSGRPVAEARVRWGPVGSEDERRLRDEYRADQLLTSTVVRTDVTGAFRLERLVPGRLLLKVEREGYADWYRKDLTVLAGAPRTDLEVELTPSLTVQGRVLDAKSRRPVAEAWIYAREESPGENEPPADEGRVRALVSGQTDAEGRYELEGLAPGRYEVVVWLALGYVAETQDRRHESVRRRNVDAGAKGIDFELVGAVEAD